MTKWSVVACDQYTSEPEYWNDVEKIVGDAPSTLKLTLPEIYLEDENVSERIAKKYDVPVISLAGYIGKGIDHLYDKGFTAIFGILAKAENIDQALKDGPQNVERTTENVVRLIAKK